MKNFLKNIVTYILITQSKLVLRKYKPKIVAVTGSVGKTSTKDAIYTAMLPFFYVRKSAKSYNSEIGIPLTVIGVPNGWNNYKIWIKNILHGFYILIFKEHYPEWLILEIGADRPGDILSITKWIKPDISVVTRIGKVPVHVEFYKSVSEVVNEKMRLAQATKKDGVLILNSDDEDVIGFKDHCKTHVISFGIENPANVVGSNINFSYDKNDKVTGMNMKVDVSGSSIPVKLSGVLGRQQIYPVLAAFAVTYFLKLNLLQVSESFEEGEVSPGRMNVIDGIKKSTIIDDTYNSSPVALEEAIKTIEATVCKGKKIAVLGDMLELGKFSGAEHIRIGEALVGKFDILVTVGIRAKNYAEGAIEKGFKKRSVVCFDDSSEAGDFVKEIIKKDDLIFVKGSQGMRMERVVERVMLNPEFKKDLLVRQDEEWLSR